MNNISISENQNITGIRKLKMYKDIFGEAPWNEGFVCSTCEKIYSKGFMGNCDCKNPLLEPFYKNKELKQSFSEISLKDGYKEIVASILGDNVGFIWGWTTDILNINKDKLGLNENELKELIISIKRTTPDFNFNKFYYFAEIGVKKDFRGKDIAGRLYRNNLEEIKKTKNNDILVTTTKKSDVPYKWFLKEGFQEVFSFNDSQDKVVLIKKFIY